MPYVPQQAPPNLDTDGLRKWTEEEFQRLARAYAETESALDTAETSIAAAESAWTAFTPTVNTQAGSSTVTAAGRYKLIGKTVHFNVNLTITAAGTGTGYIEVTIPPAGVPLSGSNFVVSENLITGLIGWVRLVASGTKFRLLKYDNSTYIATNHVLYFNGTYEVV